LSPSTTTARHARLLALALCLLVAACGPTAVVVKGNFPPPLVQPLPLSLGVWYDADFSGHEFSDAGEEQRSGGWVVTTGAAQVQMWDTVLGGLFAKLVHLDAKPAPGRPAAQVDGVLVPHVEELQYAIPAQNRAKVYEIWIRYRFELLSPAGEPLAQWVMSSYGKTPTAFLQSDQEAVNLAAVMALRDAGANFTTTFDNDPAVQAWLRDRGAHTGSGTP